MDSKRKPKFKKSSLGLFGLIIICIGIVLIGKDYFLDKKQMTFIKMNVKLFESETPKVATAEEYDYPITPTTSSENIYDGKAGVNLGFIDRLVLGLKEGNLRLAFSRNNTADTKIINNRNRYGSNQNKNRRCGGD